MVYCMYYQTIQHLYETNQLVLILLYRHLCRNHHLMKYLIYLFSQKILFQILNIYQLKLVYNVKSHLYLPTDYQISLVIQALL
nr:MAG TPA: hypothetical protein [Crassvirales sp.]